jgi:hypothetical protein
MVTVHPLNAYREMVQDPTFCDQVLQQKATRRELGS